MIVNPEKRGRGRPPQKGEYERFSPQRIREIQQTINQVTVSCVNHEGEESDIYEYMEDENSVPITDSILDSETTTIIDSCLNGLKPKHREIIIRRFGLFGAKQCTQAQIARDFGITRSGIFMLEATAMGRLKQEFSRRGLCRNSI